MSTADSNWADMASNFSGIIIRIIRVKFGEDWETINLEIAQYKPIYLRSENCR